MWESILEVRALLSLTKSSSLGVSGVNFCKVRGTSGGGGGGGEGDFRFEDCGASVLVMSLRKLSGVEATLADLKGSGSFSLN